MPSLINQFKVEQLFILLSMVILVGCDFTKFVYLNVTDQISDITLINV